MADKRSKKKLQQGEYTYALRMMRAMRKRIHKEIELVRPDEEFVIVDSVNDDGTVIVHHQETPTKTFQVGSLGVTPFAIASTVRIGGKRGDRYITAIPNRQIAECPPAFIGYSASSIVPAGWLLCDGSVYDPVRYSTLYLYIGSTFGGTATAPQLPGPATLPAYGTLLPLIRY